MKRGARVRTVSGEAVRSKRKRPWPLSLTWWLLSLVICTVFISACVVMAVFSKTSPETFAKIEIDEMLPRLDYLQDISTMFLEDQIDEAELNRILGSSSKADIWDASIFAFRADDCLFISPEKYGSERTDSLDGQALAETYKADVLKGKEIRDTNGIIVGVPIKNEAGEVVGAVFMVKPLHEIDAAVNEIKTSLLSTLCLVLLIMLVPAYALSYALSRPLRNMTAVASSMCAGNYGRFTVREGSSEVISLGKSLNMLSETLNSTINSLTVERNRLNSVLNGISEGLIAFDSQGNVIQYNSSAVRFLSGDAAATFDSGLQSELYLKIKAAVNEVNDAEPQTVFVHKLRDVVLQVDVESVLGSGENNSIALIRDITEMYRYEQTRRDYVANVSHELKTPIASIRGLADALNDGLIRTDEGKQRYYGFILNETLRLQRLIEDLLELSRLQSDSFEITLHKVCIADVVEGVADRFNRLVRMRNATLKTEVEGDLPLAFTNADRIEQVIIILTDNAVMHSSSEVVTIFAKKSNNGILIGVRNAGEIDKHDIQHIFERFYKADKSHSGQGSGLGLSIASEVMEKMGCPLNVSSKNGVVIFSFEVRVYDASHEKAMAK